MFDGRHRNLLLQSRAAIAAAGAVDLNHALVTFVGNFGARDPDGTAGDLQHVASLRTHAPQVGWRQSRDGVTDILDCAPLLRAVKLAA